MEHYGAFPLAQLAERVRSCCADLFFDHQLNQADARMDPIWSVTRVRLPSTLQISLCCDCKTDGNSASD